MSSYQKTTAVESSTEEITKVLYTAKTHTSGGRCGGVSRSGDGRLDVKFSAPIVPGTGTNPEQLFAAGWSACFISAMGLVANRMKVKLPAEIGVDAVQFWRRLLPPSPAYRQPAGLSADWTAQRNKRWTVPVGGGAGKLFKIGTQPLNARAEYLNDVRTTSGGADWQLQTQLQFLFIRHK
jgi:hypothetical protein